ncbi:alpha-L-fucosidase [Micromonospora sp. SL1-18]|uniref:alpha-L-fucosidase n=1 Tax=Micromonospora sp. SL1-18 TaxID=3399128 RepID=UPI003A4DC24B
MDPEDVSRRAVLLGATALGASAALGWLPPTRRASAANGTSTPASDGPYVPTAQSLGQHPGAAWFRDAKFGIFIHWGVYAVPAWGDALAYHPAEWYSYAMHIGASGLDTTYQHHLHAYGADVNYDDLIPQFTAANYDPRAWVELFERAGARYFVLTSKHHDGFQLFPNTASDRNSVMMGPHRDLVGELFHAARNSSLKRGLYHSLGEFFSPALDTPPWNPYTHEPIPYVGYKPIDDYVSQYLHVMVKTLIDRYDPDLLWGDGHHWHEDLGAGPAFKPKDMNWHSNELLAYYYNNAVNRSRPKEVMVNDRFEASHADFSIIEGDVSSYSLRSSKWEACLTLGRSWGYDTNEDPAKIKSPSRLVQLLVDIVSKNGNLLLNVGPRPDGTIPDWQSERLLAIGNWLLTNGTAIYDTAPWTRAGDGNLRYTVSEGSFNILGLTWPQLSFLTVPADLPIASDSQIRLLGDEGHKARFRRTDAGVEIDLPARNPNGEGYPFVLTVKHAR